MDYIAYWLGRLYKHHVVESYPAEDKTVMSLFKERLSANQSLKDDAKTRLALIPDEVTQRCFISKKNKEFLTSALED